MRAAIYLCVSTDEQRESLDDSARSAAPKETTVTTIRLTDEARVLARADGDMERAVSALDGRVFPHAAGALRAVEAACGECDTRDTTHSTLVFCDAWTTETGAQHAVCELVA